MKIEPMTLPELASLLQAERKRQKLTRAQAAAVCNVSPSFIRDAETQPERCSLGKLVQLVNGLGLTMSIAGHPGKVSRGIIFSAMQDSPHERASDVFRAVTEESRASNELRQSSAGIINSAWQRSGKEK
jgi:HTH-type transcriptional regulator/antitoxin HipB